MSIDDKCVNDAVTNLYDSIGNEIKVNDPVLYVVEDEHELDAYIAVVMSIDFVAKSLVLSMCDSIATRIETKVDRCIKFDISKKLEEGYLLQFIDSNNHYFYLGRSSDKPSRCIELSTIFKTARGAESAWRNLINKNADLKQFDPIIISYHEARRRLFIRRRRPELIILNKKLKDMHARDPMDNTVYDKVMGLIGEIEVTLAKEI